MTLEHKTRTTPTEQARGAMEPIRTLAYPNSRQLTHGDEETTLDDLKSNVRAFGDKPDWDQFHDPLTISNRC
jgi:hypothetical protein